MAEQLNDLILRTVLLVSKAVQWNSPFYGIEGDGRFLNFHCLTTYAKVAFFAGSQLDPLPPGASKVEGVRYLDVYEKDGLDEEQMTAWIRQAAALPGWKG